MTKQTIFQLLALYLGGSDIREEGADFSVEAIAAPGRNLEGFRMYLDFSGFFDVLKHTDNTLGVTTNTYLIEGKDDHQPLSDLQILALVQQYTGLTVADLEPEEELEIPTGEEIRAAVEGAVLTAHSDETELAMFEKYFQ